jgi:hypothetical protein
MDPHEVLLFPKCDLAQTVMCCWHDVIKNRIQSFSNPLLKRWLDEAVNVERFEEALNSVVENLEGFSPAHAIAGLSPFLCMEESARRDLASRLSETFEGDFDLTLMRERLHAVVRPLMLAIDEYKDSRDESNREALLCHLRETAKAVRVEFEALPRGFWLPAR